MVRSSVRTLLCDRPSVTINVLTRTYNELFSIDRILSRDIVTRPTLCPALCLMRFIVVNISPSLKPQRLVSGVEGGLGLGLGLVHATCDGDAYLSGT